MENLFNPQERDGVMRRLSTLQPSSPRQWGRMNAAQMLAHCAAVLEIACGDRVTKQRLVGRIFAPFVRPSVLGAKPFSRNGPTDPDFRIVDDRDFAKEKERVTALLTRFCQRGPSAADGLVHTFFGRLSGDQWGRLMYKHLDHHLRQFSA